MVVRRVVLNRMDFVIMFIGRGRVKVVIECLSCRRKDVSEGVVKLCFILNCSIC